MNIRFQFMKYRKIAGIASLIIFTISVFSLAFRGLSLGLDFSGGTLVEVSYETPVELESIRNTLIENGYEDSQVVNFGTNLDVLIKVADQNGNSSIGEAVYTLLNEQGFKGELKRVEFANSTLLSSPLKPCSFNSVYTASPIELLPFWSATLINTSKFVPKLTT